MSVTEGIKELALPRDGVAHIVFAPDDGPLAINGLLSEIEQRPSLRRLFVVGDQPAVMKGLQQVGADVNDRGVKLVGIGMRGSNDVALESAGADFLCKDAHEVATLLFSERSPLSITFVVLAYNEEATVAATVDDVLGFGDIYLEEFEVVVVNDGSTDGTVQQMAQFDDVRVRLVSHEVNRGMGAAFSTGYQAATMDYVVPLPADRQIRPQVVLDFLPLLDDRTAVLSFYHEPPFNWVRTVVSFGFRVLVRVVGGMKVNFTGVYAFPRHYFDLIDHSSIPARTFLYSFEMFERMARAGLDFRKVTIHHFPREVGESRVFSVRRILRIMVELFKCRLARRHFHK